MIIMKTTKQSRQEEDMCLHIQSDHFEFLIQNIIYTNSTKMREHEICVYSFTGLVLQL